MTFMAGGVLAGALKRRLPGTYSGYWPLSSTMGGNNAPLLWGRWAKKSRGTSKNYPHSYQELRAEVLAEGRCCVCGGGPRVKDPLEVDHIVPIKLGGTHALENMRPMHRSHNRRRGAELANHLRGGWKSSKYPAR